MSDRYPDIEIYIKQPGPERILAWLEGRFQQVETRRKGGATVCTMQPGNIECVIVDDAADGRFASVWFKSSETPWASDLDCARDAFAALGLEVRCSAGSWREDDEAGGWLRISGDGETPIDWS